MKLVTYNNFNGTALDESAIGKPIIAFGVPLGYISGFSGGADGEDSEGSPLWVEIEIWDCGWSIAEGLDDEFIGINYIYPYQSLSYEAEEEDY